MTDNMSRDYGTVMKSQWMTDIMEVSKHDVKKAYSETREVPNANNTGAVMHRWKRMVEAR
jgi:hypothetical protein